MQVVYGINTPQKKMFAHPGNAVFVLSFVMLAYLSNSWRNYREYSFAPFMQGQITESATMKAAAFKQNNS